MVTKAEHAVPVHRRAVPICQQALGMLFLSINGHCQYVNGHCQSINGHWACCYSQSTGSAHLPTGTAPSISLSTQHRTYRAQSSDERLKISRKSKEKKGGAHSSMGMSLSIDGIYRMPVDQRDGPVSRWSFFNNGY